MLRAGVTDDMGREYTCTKCTGVGYGKTKRYYSCKKIILKNGKVINNSANKYVKDAKLAKCSGTMERMYSREGLLLRQLERIPHTICPNRMNPPMVTVSMAEGASETLTTDVLLDNSPIVQIGIELNDDVEDTVASAVKAFDSSSAQVTGGFSSSTQAPVVGNFAKRVMAEVNAHPTSNPQRANKICTEMMTATGDRDLSITSEATMSAAVTATTSTDFLETESVIRMGTEMEYLEETVTISI